MCKRKSKVNDLPFDEKIMSKGRRLMKSYDGIHPFWWVFWAVVFFPMLIVLYAHQRKKLHDTQIHNEEVYYSLYTKTPFKSKTKIPIWLIFVVLVVIYKILMWYFIKEV